MKLKPVLAVTLLVALGATAGAQVAVPTPTITSISPQETTAGTDSFWLTIAGGGFRGDGVSMVSWDTELLLPEPTTLTDTLMMVWIDASLVATPHTVQVQVVNIRQLYSKVVLFTINARLAITTKDIKSATVGVYYSQQFDVTGGTKPLLWSFDSLPPGLLLNNAGLLSGTPTKEGPYPFTVRVSDPRGGQDEEHYTLIVNPAGPTITTASPLPDATVGSAYSQTLAATGGTQPYSWSATGLPPGLTLSTEGVLGGTPTRIGTFSLSVTVTDAAQARAAKQFSLTVNPVALSILAASLPNATVGSAYSQSMVATGGTQPYSWSATGLPPGLTLSTAGVLSGTPTQGGASTFTVTVTDAAQATASEQFTLTVAVPPAPPVSVTLSVETVGPAQQPTVDVQLSSPYALAIAGTITLAFTPNAANPSDDPSIQFSTGGRTTSFTIPASQTSASWPSTHSIQTGTVAGTITLTLRLSAGGQDITPTPAPSRSVTIARAAPTIRSVQVQRTSSGFNVLVTGYSTPRQVTQAVFAFTAASGANLQTTQLPVSVESAFTTWYTGASSTPFGSLFLYTQPFTVTGNTSDVASVSVTLSNAVGSSSPASANVPN